MAILDAYEFKARLTPGLLGCAPIAVAVAALNLKSNPTIALSLSIAGGLAGTYALSVFVAHKGREAQEKLWSAWGGSATMRFLRLREPTSNTTQRDIWRAAIESSTGITLLSADQEIADPVEADNRIQAAIDQKRPLGQDAPAVKNENAQYGFERNLYGFRTYGKWIAFLCAAVLAGVFVANSHLHPRAFDDGALVAGIVINASLLLAWLTMPSEARTKAASDRYAQQLLQAVVLETRNAGSSSTSGQGDAT